jgi:hypothetical protein
MSVEYSYVIATAFPDGSVNLREWSQSISEDETITKNLESCHFTEDNLNVVAVFDEALPTEEETALEAINSGHAILQATKDTKTKAIDKKTSELIGNGFVYDSTVFSLSLESQTKLAGSHQVKDEPEFTYPVKWNSKDDKNTKSLANSSEMRAFYLTALGTVRVHLDSGTTLKDQVRAATTVAEVDAIVDDR